MSPPPAAPKRRGVVLALGSAEGASSALRALRDLRERHDLRIAMTAAQALDLAAAMPAPDLVLVDLEASGLAGVAVCRDLKRSTKTSAIPVVVVALPSDPLLDEVEAIVDGVLPKPVNVGLLLARVSAAVEDRDSSRAPAPVDPSLEPGTRVGDYRIDAKLGSGAFGDVYAATHPTTTERVAIKVLARTTAGRESEVVARFIAEAKAANRIRQRNIIEIFSFGVHEETRQHYFVMELLEGETLRELIARRGRVPPREAIPILRAIADGLDAAHAAGVTHRDLKPDNVFLSRRASEAASEALVKILDFGIAKLSGEDAAFRTRSGVVLGTPRYMSPEQARGRSATHAADIYALGVITHEILTGSAPFSGPALDVLLQHATDPPPRASSVAPDAGLTPEIDAAILAMLAKRPEARPPSAGDAVSGLASAFTTAPSWCF